MNSCTRSDSDSQVHPDDRVLVAVMSRPRDLAIAREQGWYRMPEERASRCRR